MKSQIFAHRPHFYLLERNWNYRYEITIGIGYWIHGVAINVKPLKLLRTTNLNSSLLVNEGLCKL